MPWGGAQKRGKDGHEKKGAWSQASKQSQGVAGALCKWHLERESGAGTPEWQGAKHSSWFLQQVQNPEVRENETKTQVTACLQDSQPWESVRTILYTGQLFLICPWWTLVDYSRSMQTGSQSESHSQEQRMSQTLLTMLTATREWS